MAFALLLLLAYQFAAAPSTVLPGGRNPAGTEDPDVAKAANFAVSQLSQASGSDYAMVMTSLVEATKQVVAGTKYELLIRTSMTTDCRNGGELATLENCRPDMSTAKYFQVQVMWQPWMDPEFTLLKSEEIDVSEEEAQFQEYISEYKKVYLSDAPEYEKRLEIFQDNLREIAMLQENEQGTAIYGVNEFTDLSKEEFKAGHMMPNGWPLEDTDTELPMTSELPLEDAPSAFDWREKGVVTPVKNQGTCGSCWAFSTTGNIEGQWAIRHRELISLSEQELVDCDMVDHGCQGGLPANAYKQIIEMGGLESESDYPYQARDMTCRMKSDKVVVTINGSLSISSDEEQMAAWLAVNGPISIGINAEAMQSYVSGISDPWSLLCNPDDLNHGVLIVGYGQEGDKPFWIIKNSWGTSWGEEGYYRIVRGAGKCGVNKMPTSATVA